MISDRLVHASIVDGIRLAKAIHDTYKHCDMAHLEEKLQEHQDKRVRLIITDASSRWTAIWRARPDRGARREVQRAGVPRRQPCVRFHRRTGRGVHEHFGVMAGSTSSRPRLARRWRGERRLRVGAEGDRRAVPPAARPYLFSNAVPRDRRVGHQGARNPQRHDRASRQARDKREVLAAGPHRRRVRHQEGESPIVPVMLFNAKLAQDVARDLYYEGIYVVGFFFRLSRRAARSGRSSRPTTTSDAGEGLEAFKKVGARHGILGWTRRGSSRSTAVTGKGREQEGRNSDSATP